MDNTIAHPWNLFKNLHKLAILKKNKPINISEFSSLVQNFKEKYVLLNVEPRLNRCHFMKVGTRNNISLLIFLLLLIFSSSCASSKKVRKKNVQQVIETAKSYRGTPYRYGGTTRSGIDCSALIYHSFASVGMKVPRTSEEQSKMGKKIPESKVEKGDVLFFATGKNKRKVSHTGLVTEVKSGEVIFIHSSTSLGVTEDKLSQTYWTKAYLFAKRYF